MKIGHRGIAVEIALALLGATPAFAEDEPEPRRYLSTSFNYLKGDYGTGEDTEIIYVPFTFGIRLERFRLGVTVPYLRQTSQNVVLTGGGVAAKKKDTPTASATEGRTEDGLGEVALMGFTHDLPRLEEHHESPSVAVGDSPYPTGYQKGGPPAAKCPIPGHSRRTPRGGEDRSR